MNPNFLRPPPPLYTYWHPQPPSLSCTRPDLQASHPLSLHFPLVFLYWHCKQPDILNNNVYFKLPSLGSVTSLLFYSSTPPKRFVAALPTKQSQTYPNYPPTKVTCYLYSMFSSNLSGFLRFFSTSSSLKCSIPFPYISLHSSAYLSGPAFSILGASLLLPAPWRSMYTHCSWSAMILSFFSFNCLPFADNAQIHLSSPNPQLAADSQSLNISTWMPHGHLEFTDLKCFYSSLPPNCSLF